MHKPGEPLLVLLAKGRVVTAWDSDLTKLLQQLHLDPQLDIGALMTLLLFVAVDIMERSDSTRHSLSSATSCAVRSIKNGEYPAWNFCRRLRQS